MASDSICTDSPKTARDVRCYEIPDVGLTHETDSAQEETASSGLAIRIEYGCTSILDSELGRLVAGHIVELDEPLDSDIRILADGRLIALGELVTIEGNVGVRIKRLLLDEETTE